MLKHLKPALESIAYQGDGFHRQMTLVFEPYIGKPLKPSDVAEIEKKLNATIKKRTKVDIEISLTKGYHPCIYIETMDAGSMFADLFGIQNIDYEKSIKEIAREKKVKGFVDLEKSIVGGFFEKKFSKMYFDPFTYISSGKYTAGEIAAICEHEVGHFFGICEFIDRTVSTNQVLAHVDRKLKNNTDVKQREIIIKSAVDELNLDQRVFEDLKNSTSDKTVSTVLAVESVKLSYSVRSQNNKKYYDLNTPEMMSDDFAARHGAGPDLVTALDKLMKEFSLFGVGHVQKRNTAMYILMEAFKIILFIAGVMTAATFGSIIISIGLSLLLNDSYDAGEPTYDGLKNRLLRVKSQLVDCAKNASGSPAIQKQLLKDIEVIESITNQYNDRKDLLGYLVSLVSSNTKVRDYQVNLERLVLNDFFVQSLKFRTM